MRSVNWPLDLQYWPEKLRVIRKLGGTAPVTVHLCEHEGKHFTVKVGVMLGVPCVCVRACARVCVYVFVFPHTCCLALLFAQW